MTKCFYATVILSCLVLCSGPVMAEPPKAAPSEPAAGVSESTSAAAAAAPPAESARASELAKKIHSMISRPPEEMALLARQIVNPLLASLRYDRKIAQLETREKRAEEIRGALIIRADEKAQELESVRGELDVAIEAVRRQFADEPQQAEGELAAVAQLYRGRLRQLKSEEEGCRRQAAVTGRHLGEIRAELANLGRARRVCEQRNRHAGQEIVVPTIQAETTLYPVWLDEMPVRAGVPASKPAESFGEIMKSLEDL
ncbi:MAG: hypothetical protein ABIP48_31260 [Planctomycetota bacterium]